MKTQMVDEKMAKRPKKIPTRCAAAVAGNKGGVGKTAFCVNIAFELADRGGETWFIDTDYAQKSALKWLMGREKGYKVDHWYKVHENLNAICVSRKSIVAGGLSDIAEKWRKGDARFLIFDGRPEPDVSGEIITALLEANMNSTIILPVQLAADSVDQAESLGMQVKRVAEGKLNCVSFVNMGTSSKISKELRETLEKMDFDWIGDLNMSERIKWAERDCRPLRLVSGAKRTKHYVMIDYIVRGMYRGRV